MYLTNQRNEKKKKIDEIKNSLKLIVARIRLGALGRFHGRIQPFTEFGVAYRVDINQIYCRICQCIISSHNKSVNFIDCRVSPVPVRWLRIMT